MAAIKGHVVPFDPQVAELICHDLRGRGIRSTAFSPIRLLGVEFAGGGKPGRTTWAKLLAKGKGRAVKLRIARAAGITTARFSKTANETAAL